MLSSLARYLEPLPDEEGDPFLTEIQALFQSEFIAKQQSPDQEERESLNISYRPVESDDFAYDQQIGEARPEEGGRDSDPDSGKASDGSTETTDTTSETNSSTVLHLGSVLSTEHDYLLWRTIYVTVCWLQRLFNKFLCKYNEVLRQYDQLVFYCFLFFSIALKPNSQWLTQCICVLCVCVRVREREIIRVV